MSSGNKYLKPGNKYLPRTELFSPLRRRKEPDTPTEADFSVYKSKYQVRSVSDNKWRAAVSGRVGGLFVSIRKLWEAGCLLERDGEDS